MSATPEIIELDNLDKQILGILQDDAKASLREIEERTNLSTTSIRMRIKRLKEKNVIKKYITLIECRYLGYREMVMVSLRVNSSKKLKELKSIIEEMGKVKYAYIITGEYPLFVMAKCLDHNDSLELIETLRNLPGVEEVKTQIVLDKIKEDPTIIIP
ncbi:MAG: Lrp/AsnC family transcriptional regulator [Candidatus Thorarchaeota archaeon]